jgi:EAL domain-containing protein (putative c-di-GMP-specific phosphodiesterase class I)
MGNTATYIASAPSQVATTFRDRARRARVLIVDDEARITTSFRRLFSGTPYELITANSGTEGLRVLGSTEIDVVISDENMPGMVGSAFLAEVRRLHPGVMRVILTGDPMLSKVIDGLNSGMLFRYLQKPPDDQQILDCVAAAITHAGHDAAVRSAQVASAERAVLDAAFDNVLATLWMAAQPIVDPANRHVFAYEFLLRAREPSLPHPGAILDAAEALDRVVELERAIRNSVARIAPRVPAGTLLFVNLHPISLDDPDLYRPDAPLAQFADRIVLEITERASLEEASEAPQQMDALRALGYRIAIDDLGAGYAGLNCLLRLHPDFVKLDMGLIRGIDQGGSQAKVVAHAHSMCRDLGFNVIAEGVETPAERTALAGIGIGLFQGYLFARPEISFPAVNWG